MEITIGLLVLSVLYNIKLKIDKEFYKEMIKDTNDRFENYVANSFEDQRFKSGDGRIEVL
jgi:hypothetical protein